MLIHGLKMGQVSIIDLDGERLDTYRFQMKPVEMVVSGTGSSKTGK